MSTPEENFRDRLKTALAGHDFTAAGEGAKFFHKAYHGLQSRIGEKELDGKGLKTVTNAYLRIGARLKKASTDPEDLGRLNTSLDAVQDAHDRYQTELLKAQAVASSSRKPPRPEAVASSLRVPPRREAVASSSRVPSPAPPVQVLYATRDYARYPPPVPVPGPYVNPGYPSYPPPPPVPMRGQYATLYPSYLPPMYGPYATSGYASYPPSPQGSSENQRAVSTSPQTPDLNTPPNGYTQSEPGSRRPAPTLASTTRPVSAPPPPKLKRRR